MVFVEFVEEVIIALDNYEEIFDDFDIRDYSSRTISSDFLYELKRRIFNLRGRIKLILTIPSSLRDKKVEQTIIKRLKQFFILRYEKYLEKKKVLQKKGITYTLVGLLILIAIFFIEIHFSDSSEFFPILTNFLFIPSWFFVWNGLDKLLEVSRQYDRTIAFYNKLVKTKLIFEEEEKYED